MNAKTLQTKKILKRKAAPKAKAAPRYMATKNKAINMRALPEQQALLNKAASYLNMDRSVFILDVACKAAENVLLDRRLFQLSDQDYDAFEAALSEPLPSNKKLKELLAEEAPWK